MDEILYIILGVIWLAWSLYSNKQKVDKRRTDQAQREAEARQAQAEMDMQPTDRRYETVKPAPKSPEKSVFEELFGEFIPQEEADEDEYIPEIDEKGWQKKIADYSKSEIQSLEEIKEEVPADYFNKLYNTEYKTVEQQVINNDIAEEVYNENSVSDEDFDLKRALIYSEILRAPYISGAA